LKSAPFPHNEIGRITALADLNPDYTNLDESFRDLAKLAAKVTGSPISMINLIDNYTVWTVSAYGFEVQQTPREESICQYTILEKDQFAVPDLGENAIFRNEEFVTGDMHFRFYHGVPLTTQDQNLGALCVIDRNVKSLPAEKVELLKIIADEIINRLKIFQHMESLRNKVTEVKQTQNKVVHDIRGPIAGIIGLSQIISEQGQHNKLDQVLEFINLIHKGGRSILELADEILTEEKQARSKAQPNEMMLQTFRQRLEELYFPQARSKDIALKVNIGNTGDDIAFPQNKLMQIAGNLISNAIKFTPKSGSVTVSLSLIPSETENSLKITVADTGDGIDEEQIAILLADNTASAEGTGGEKGYGFGLALVKHLVKGLNGTFSITSEKNVGSKFEVCIPFKL
jgi:signal transduction histidine kinase